MGARRVPALVLVSCLLGPPALALSSAASEPAFSGSLLLPGRLIFGLSALPTGELLAPCEDQTLSVLDDRANVLTSWTARARFSQPVSVAPPGPVQLVSAPLLSGRVEVLVFDPRTRALGSQFALAHSSAPAAPTVWDASGHLYQAWKDGHLEAWTPHGELVWSREVGFAPQAVMNDETQGLFVAGPDLLTLVDHSGRTVQSWALDGTPRGLLQTLAGSLYVWTQRGLWWLDPALTSLREIVHSATIVGVTTDRQNRLLVTEVDHWTRRTASGGVLTRVALPHAALSEAVVDDRGRLFVATSAGLEQWTYAGTPLATLGRGTPVTAPLLTEQGLLAWGSDDWVVQTWTGGQLPPFAWPEAGGGPRRAWSTTRPVSLTVRAANWSDVPEFGYFLQLASSGDDGQQQTVLSAFEARAAQGNLAAAWPWADVVLIKILRSGLTDLEQRNSYVTNNWPQNRLRAYRLLADMATPEDRDELLAILDKEFDDVNLGQGALALARTGWDGDGKLMHMLATIQARRPHVGVVADALVDAARALWLSGGRTADPTLVPLLTGIYQSDVPRSVRTKAQTFFQDLMDAP